MMHYCSRSFTPRRHRRLKLTRGFSYLGVITALSNAPRLNPYLRRACKNLLSSGAGRFSRPIDGAASEIFNLCRTATPGASDRACNFIWPVKPQRFKITKRKEEEETEKKRTRRVFFFSLYLSLVRSYPRIYSQDTCLSRLEKLRKRIKIDTCSSLRSEISYV